jgi:hypothetical protein
VISNPFKSRLKRKATNERRSAHECDVRMSLEPAATLGLNVFKLVK